MLSRRREGVATLTKVAVIGLDAAEKKFGQGTSSFLVDFSLERPKAQRLTICGSSDAQQAKSTQQNRAQ
jgi:hypothetical protein